MAKMVYLVTKKGKRHLIEGTKRNGETLTALQEARRIIAGNPDTFFLEEDATPVKNEKSKKILKEANSSQEVDSKEK